MTTDPLSTEHSRRHVLGWFATAAVVSSLSGCSSTSDEPHAAVSMSTTPKSTTERVVVVIELSGGNDGLSTVIPFRDDRYHRLRPTLALQESELGALDDDHALNEELMPLTAFGLAALMGVGSARPSLSHFDMLARWWSGSPNHNPNGGSGFLTRLSTELQPGDRPVGISISSLPTPAMSGKGSATITIPTAVPLGTSFVGDSGAGVAFRTAMERLGRLDTSDDLRRAASVGVARAMSVDSMLMSLPTVGPEYERLGPEATLAAQLGFAAQLIRAGAGVRVVHIPVGDAVFDTHAGHRARHARLMSGLARELGVFLQDMRDLGMADRVLVVTTSEFGRRVAENDGGLDHGAASCALLLGPVHPGLHGEPCSLDRLDDDGNLIATVPFDRYLATISTWMGVEPAKVLDDRVRPLTGIVV